MKIGSLPLFRSESPLVIRKLRRVTSFPGIGTPPAYMVHKFYKFWSAGGDSLKSECIYILILP